jgi:secreted trypsin-like serine protease
MRVLTAIAGAFLAALALVPAANAAPANTPDGDVQPYIIGGGFASSAPWAARLFANGRENCSATIIAPTWILTAHHCVANTSATYTFRIGNIDQTAGTLRTGTQVIRHGSADLALVRINQAVSTTYSPLGTTADVRVNQNVQLFGWGATCTNQPEINCQSRYLKYANTTVTSVGCSDYRGGIAVCVRRGDGIAAGGDSGGPMFASGRQVGVASTSDRATRSAYTNITRYRTWISQNAGV